MGGAGAGKSGQKRTGTPLLVAACCTSGAQQVLQVRGSNASPQWEWEEGGPRWCGPHAPSDWPGLGGAAPACHPTLQLARPCGRGPSCGALLGGRQEGPRTARSAAAATGGRQEQGGVSLGRRAQLERVIGGGAAWVPWGSEAGDGVGVRRRTQLSSGLGVAGHLRSAWAGQGRQGGWECTGRRCLVDGGWGALPYGGCSTGGTLTTLRLRWSAI